MENNFGLILLDSVRKNKDKYLGLLRRNGVLVNTSISNEDLANMILKAMQKSDSFKKEAILLMGVLISERNDGNFANVGGYFGNLPKFDENLFSSPASPTTTPTTTTKPKKEFADTTVGTIFDKLFTLGNSYLQNKELDVRKVEAETGGKISDNKVILDTKEKDKPDEKSNVGLYIGLGVGGLALVGVLVYVIAKKQ